MRKSVQCIILHGSHNIVLPKMVRGCSNAVGELLDLVNISYYKGKSIPNTPVYVKIKFVWHYVGGGGREAI